MAIFIVKVKEDKEIGIQSTHKEIKDFEKEKGKREKKLTKAIERLEKKKDKKVKFKDHLLKGKYQIIETDLTLEELQADEDIESVEEDNTDVYPCAGEIGWAHGNDYAGTKLGYHAKGLTGAGIKVAVLDSGINYNHENLDVKGGALIRDGVVVSQNVPSDYLDTASAYDGHGTMVASALASLDNGVGVLGAAPGVDLYAYRVTDAQGKSGHATFARALELAVDNGMKVVNLSYGTISGTDVWFDACEYAYENNVSVVVAAGNDGTKFRPNGFGSGIGVLNIGAAENPPFAIADYLSLIHI